MTLTERIQRDQTHTSKQGFQHPGPQAACAMCQIRVRRPAWLDRAGEDLTGMVVS